MKLNPYFRGLLGDANFYTPSSIEVPQYLSEHFHSALVHSDHAVRERGRTLHWEVVRGTSRLTLGAEFKGEAERVNLDIAAQSQLPTYIGDFHTHPYLEKYGRQYSIAPSNGDWTEWARNPPAAIRISVHFVASGTTLFLLVIRNPNAAAIAVTFAGPAEAARLNELVRDWSDHDQVEYSELSEARRWLQLRQLFGRNRPDARAVHQEDANSMNVQTANRNGCEYFSGPLNPDGTTLALRSNRVMGNWFTANLWSSRSDPFLRWPF